MPGKKEKLQGLLKTLNSMEDNQPKPGKARKVTDGTIRNKERTRQKWLNAVGEVLSEKGFAGLTVRNITEKAGLDRKLIAVYFNGLDGLIEEYLNRTDYWMGKVAPRIGTIIGQSGQLGQEAVTKILHALFDEVNASENLQKMLSWQVGEYQEGLRKLADSREALGKPMFKMTDPDFDGTGIDLRAILAIQIAGIYYLNLNAKVNGSTFCEIDLNKPKGKKAIKNALSKIIELLYRESNR